MDDRRARQAAILLRRLDRRSTRLDDASLDRPALVCAPHPDDETLGCGGTIATKRDRGVPVTVVVVSRGERSHAHLMDPEQLAAIRAREVRAACAVLGVENVELLGLPDGAITDRHELAVRRLAECIASNRPEQVFVPFHAEGVPDHVATRSAALRAVHLVGRPVEVLEYPVWFWTQVPQRSRAWGVRGRLRRLFELIATPSPSALGKLDHFVDISTTLARKQAALAEHRSQTCRLLDDPRWLVLADVEGGHLLRMATANRERFARIRPTASPS